jgi:hypothetical protein
MIGDAAGAETPEPAPAGEIFAESTDTGLDFVQFNGATGDFLLPEITCGGAGMFDYDNDGDLDLYLLQGRLMAAGQDISAALFPPPEGQPLTDRLYRNDSQILPNGDLQLRFVDVTEESGIEAGYYGCGAAAGDYDNDGWVDLYLANLGPNQLFHNEGDGGFREIPLDGGLEDPRWSIAVTWLDFDNDGWLDLFVGNYLEFDVDKQKICRTQAGARDYCNPAAYLGVPDRLFHNVDHGALADVTVTVGIARPLSKSLAVVAADFTGDDLPDLYVTNDGIPNQLWIQQPGGRFADGAMLAGCAVNRLGRPEASMGVSAEDFDNDGDLDLFMTHITGETNTFFLNQGDGLFQDRTVQSGLSQPSWSYTSWGLAWMDYDNDRLLDMAIANGAVRALQELADAGDPFPFHQPNQLFRYQGNGRYADVSPQAGAAFQRSEVSRALTVGDLDSDGDPDLVSINLGAPARVLINTVGGAQRWLGARLLGGPGRRDMVGSRVEVVLANGERAWRRVKTDGSFASANDPRVLVGLGKDAEVTAIRAHWPGGEVTEYRSPDPDHYLILVQAGNGMEP